MNYKTYLKGKKVTVMGLGLLGKGLGDTVFLAKAGADVTVTDLKTERELESSVAPLKKYKNVRLVLGRHDFKDFENCDFVLKAQGVRLDSMYIAHARARGIPIRMDDELFVELAPKSITVIGVTGTRGKTTTATLLYDILKKAGKRAHLAGNIRGIATLNLLPKIKSGDIVILELSSWQLQGFGDAKISPHIALFTNFMPEHMNYYDNNLKHYFADKANIFKYQKKGDILVVSKSIAKRIPKKYPGTLVLAHDAYVPKSWQIPILGEHNHANVAQAVATARALKVPMTTIKKAVESFKAVSGRLQYVKKVMDVEIYNDNSSSTPHSTIKALHAVGDPAKKNIVLIMGGSDKGLDAYLLMKEIPKFCKSVILIPGTGTTKFSILSRESKLKTIDASSIREAVDMATREAQKGDIILFSPAFASFGEFTNVYDREDQFLEIVKKLK